jgi:hypothetical protein
MNPHSSLGHRAAASVRPLTTPLTSEQVEYMLDQAHNLTRPASNSPTHNPAGLNNSAPLLDQQFIELLSRYRPWGGLTRFSCVLAVRRPMSSLSLAGWITEGSAFGFDWQGDFWMPEMQFDLTANAPRRWVAAVCGELTPVFDDWAVAQWLVEPNAWLHDRYPLACVTHSLNEVVAAAIADRFIACG